MVATSAIITQPYVAPSGVQTTITIDPLVHEFAKTLSMHDLEVIVDDDARIIEVTKGKLTMMMRYELLLNWTNDSFGPKLTDGQRLAGATHTVLTQFETARWYAKLANTTGAT